ncbi:MAG: hypothetical protein A2Y71_16700 [Bacteroidetes bacterium RBG_13_42_15]|nr:MAG: hypothetical protein A2Y71_16700 [Bacteroidetes bacterium RBG_13_42_15]
MKRYMAYKSLLLLISLMFLNLNILLGQQSYLAYNVGSKTGLFTDGFDDNSNQWITNNQWVRGMVEAGYYTITCKNFEGSTGLSFKAVPLTEGTDYEIEAAIKVNSGTGALVFGMTDKYDHYRIEISDNNTLEVIKDTPSKGKKPEKLFKGPGIFQIRPDFFNKLTVRYVSGSYYVFANEVLVSQFNSIKPEGNGIGFNVGLNSEISIDFMNVSYLNTSTSPALTTREVTKPNNVIPNMPAVATGAGPAITWISPSRPTTTLESFTARVRAAVRSASGLKSVLFYVNGVSKGEGDILPSAENDQTFVVEKTINFGPGENNIYIVASNNDGAVKSELRYFTNPSAVVPVVSWSNPENENTIVNKESLPISACIKSPTELKSVKLLVNGNIQSEDNVFQVSTVGDCNYNWQSSIVLKEGDNNIYIIATNVAGSITSEKRVIKLQPSLGERRLALVFGNSQYQSGTPLRNPVNDANLMEGTLKELNFDVIKHLNASKEEMMNAIKEFNEKLPYYNVALFYYAGHGNQVEGKNFLIPVDAKLDKETDCKFEAVAVDFIVEEFEKYQENTNVVILDACRNNPFKAWSRGGEQGFKAMSFTSGTIIAFATSEGTTAADGKGANGLFTEELVKQMVIPQSILNVFMNTRVQVRKLSGNQQVPTEWNKLNGDFFFKK